MKRNKFRFHPKLAVVGFSVAALIAWGLSHWTELPFWGALLIVFCAMFINGIIAQYEDDATGGFNNPTPDQLSSPKTSHNPDKTTKPNIGV